MKKSLFVLTAFAIGALLTACKDHIPSIEEFPLAAVEFTYEVEAEDYHLDYYVGADIKFYPTVKLTSDCKWNFGDGSDPVVGDTVYHKFTVAGTYQVTAEANGGKRTNVIYISDIKPIITLIQTDSLCEVKNSYISFEVELPNPDQLDAIYRWSFPEGTTNENDEPVASFVGTAEELGKVKFAKVGSQTVALTVELGGRNLETVKKNVQVSLNEDAPTLYYAVKDGNIMALKLPASRSIEGVEIQPYDMGISSGIHPFNILYNGGYVYILDCGKQYVYVNDVDGVLGDGKLTLMAKDASTYETMMSNVGGPAFQDPFYGCIDGDYLYYSDRNTGIFRLPLSTRNETYDKNNGLFSYYVQNNYLGYYGNGMSYGSITGCYARIHDTWYWAKTYQGTGIWRFLESDILTESTAGEQPAPTSGVLLNLFMCKAFVYDELNGKFYWTIFGNGEGIYSIDFANIENIAGSVTTSVISPYMLTFADGSGVSPNVTPASTNEGEGSSSEYVAICELALDNQTGDVYFGYRPKDKSKAGLCRYNASTGKLEYVIKGVEVYGVTINPEGSKLF